MFKMLTGGDSISGEEKFKMSFNFRNIAKLWFSANEIPETLDDTIALFRRWILLVCSNIFARDKCDSHILKKLMTPTELSGFLNYALEGLKRLLTNRHFSTTARTARFSREISYFKSVHLKELWFSSKKQIRQNRISPKLR